MGLTWGRLSDLLNNAKRLDFDSAFFFVFSQSHIQLFAIELNTGSPNNAEYGQLFLDGEDSEGVSLQEIGGGYAPRTKEIKTFLGLPVDRVTLYQEGDFYKTWTFHQDAKSFTLRADTIKEGEDLQDRWGTNLVGLTDESIKILNQEAISEVIRYILRTLLS